MFAVLIAVLLVSCNSKDSIEEVKTDGAEIIISDVEEKYAPDGRVALFDVSAVEKKDQVVIKGESNLPEALDVLKERLKQAQIRYIDSVAVLPSEELGDTIYGVVPISVANLRGRPSHSAELVTQATLGTPLRVYKKKGSWYYVQTPDQYLAWVDYGGIQTMTRRELEEWKSAEKIIFSGTYGSSYQEPNEKAPIVADLVAGNILTVEGEEKGFFQVKYPDGRIAYVKKGESEIYEEWLKDLEISGESLTETSRSLMGIPYLWGGTSPKGADCSGFTKTVFFMNGLILPRDASQQIEVGIAVDSTRNFENLKAGDLLFFGRKATDSTPERIVHVGMWIGDNQFIHAMGDVHVSTMDTTDPNFDEYNYNRYIRTKRILDQEDVRVLNLGEEGLFTTAKE